jgi:hypothetical protein
VNVSYRNLPEQSSSESPGDHEQSVNPVRVIADPPRITWPGGVWRYPDIDAAELAADILAERVPRLGTLACRKPNEKEGVR